MNTAIIGDKVKAQNAVVVKVLNRSTAHIVGVLRLSARVKYGTNKRGVPIYLFNPCHHKYPKFLVCSNKRSSRDIFCTISFNKYDEVRDKPLLWSSESGLIRLPLSDESELRNSYLAF